MGDETRIKAVQITNNKLASEILELPKFLIFEKKIQGYQRAFSFKSLDKTRVSSNIFLIRLFDIFALASFMMRDILPFFSFSFIKRNTSFFVKIFKKFRLSEFFSICFWGSNIR